MKKILLSLAILLAAILRIPQVGNTYLGLGLGLGSVFVIYLFARSLTFAEKLPYFANTCAFFLAISPWHIFISKKEDVSLIFFLTILGIYILLRILKKHLTVSIVVLLLTLNFLATPIVDILDGFSNTQVPIWATDEQRREHEVYYNHPLVVLIHNKVINYTLSFFDHYSQHFQGDFLFISGDVRERGGGGGLMYLFDFIFIVIAAFYIIRNPKGWGIILILLILAPIPSALDFQPPNALKAYLMIVPLTILSAFGFTTVGSYMYNK